MAPELIADWNDAPLTVRRSRGSGVAYTEDWRRNVLGIGEPVPPALSRHVAGYVTPRGSFEEEDATALSAKLGRISRFQSLRSEDALTWSWFGTVAQATPAERQAVIQWLYDALGLELAASKSVAFRHWERVFHPNAETRHGPEVDVIVDDPRGALIYVEAKWRADLGTGRGSVAGTSDDQIVLRRDSFRKDAALSQGERPLVVLGIGPVEEDLARYIEEDASLRRVAVQWLTWPLLAECPTHPLAEEFGRYLAWKENH
jgi:hypothetical protein